MRWSNLSYRKKKKKKTNKKNKYTWRCTTYHASQRVPVLFQLVRLARELVVPNVTQNVCCVSVALHMIVLVLHCTMIRSENCVYTQAQYE
jgi:hypothetical protein